MNNPAPQTNGHKDGRGVQAYRWLVLGGLAIIGALSFRVLTQIDKTSELAASLQIIVGTLNSRLDAHVDRLAGHDRRIERVEDRVYRATP